MRIYGLVLGKNFFEDNVGNINTGGDNHPLNFARILARIRLRRCGYLILLFLVAEIICAC